jgi:hypothetical protein
VNSLNFNECPHSANANANEEYGERSQNPGARRIRGIPHCERKPPLLVISKSVISEGARS